MTHTTNDVEAGAAVDIDAADGTLTVRVWGDLDIVGAVALASAARTVAAPPAGVRRIRLDLSRVDFVDAAGWRAISRLIRDSPHGVTVVGLHGSARRCWALLAGAPPP